MPLTGSGGLPRAFMGIGQGFLISVISVSNYCFRWDFNGGLSQSRDPEVYNDAAGADLRVVTYPIPEWEPRLPHCHKPHQTCPFV
jgi:hypothetical protein